MLDAWLDLVLGSRCSACGAEGRALCGPCAVTLPTRAVLSWPTPTPDGLVPPWSAGEYAGALRALVVDHKDRNRLSLVRPLGRLLAQSVEAAVASEEGARRRAEHGRRPPVLRLVPVPSHPSVVRQRGQDPLLRLTRHAAAVLRRRGADVAVVPLLTVVHRPGDQAGLGAADRARNVAGRFRAAGPPARTAAPAPVLLVDDVVTTGATLREAQRALEEAGWTPFAAATVAATRRRSGGRSAPNEA